MKSAKSGKVLVIGGGIAGLTAGIYARKSGFEVTIAEAHSIPGGSCTSWRRKGYLFEGGMHWLNGSSPESRLHRLWRETGALKNSTRIANRDPFLVSDFYGRRACAYRDVDRFEAHLAGLSPGDVPRIRCLCATIRRFMKIKVPVTDIPFLKTRIKNEPFLGDVPAMLPALVSMPFLNRTSVRDYAGRFKDPAIRLLLSHVVNPDYDLVSLFYILSCFMAGDGGYVEGGSLRMIENMAGYFTSLGGELRCGLKADKVIVKDHRVRGMFSGGEIFPADAVIVTADVLAAAGRLFDPPLDDPWIKVMKKRTVPVMNTFFCIGVEAELPEIPEVCAIPIEPFDYAGEEIKDLSLSNYGSYPGYAPPGCAALTARIRTDSYDYWKEMRKQGLYEKKKEELSALVLDRLEKVFPSLRGKAAILDTATPLTYERYTGAYRGSWMTKALPGQSRKSYPCTSGNAEGLYFAGHRMQLPGGMPIALLTGRRAVQYLCRDSGAVFSGI
jgi:phytoene dehydrogenase-like protein